MAKSIRSKVKKRLRTVKRGVVKAQLQDPTSKLGVREVQKGEKLREALSGYIKPSARRTAPPVWPARSRCSPPALRRPLRSALLSPGAFASQFDDQSYLQTSCIP